MAPPVAKSEGRPPVSIIIPIGPDEGPSPPVFDALELIPDDWELVVVCCELSDPLNPIQSEHQVVLLQSKPGRASQMNTGAEVAAGETLWFLHADSIVSGEMIAALRQVVGDPNGFYYFQLGFLADGSGPMGINAIGANLRSRILGVPFGDQGFVLTADVFRKLSGYDEYLAYGEDHVLVWQARLAGIKARCLPATLKTSARKYRRHGWLTLTWRYQWLWLRQAFPFWLKLLKLKFGIDR